MEYMYPFLISFIMVFIAELGDKTQLLVLSFSGILKSRTILIGVALGSLFSHGLAITFGSQIALFETPIIHDTIQFLTYSSFILIGIISLLPKKEKMDSNINSKDGLIKKITKLKINYSLIIALSIIIGELGDKTFLSSIGFGIQYPNAKFFLVLGAVLGMVISNSIAIVFGKFLNNHISKNTMQKISGILFLIFGIIGFIFNK